MANYNFELKVNLEGASHTGNVLVEEVTTGKVFSSKQLEGISQEDLVQKAKDYKEELLSIIGGYGKAL